MSTQTIITTLDGSLYLVHPPLLVESGAIEPVIWFNLYHITSYNQHNIVNTIDIGKGYINESSRNHEGLEITQKESYLFIRNEIEERSLGKLTLYNSMGALVYQSAEDNDYFEISLSSGLYYLTFENILGTYKVVIL